MPTSRVRFSPKTQEKERVSFSKKLQEKWYGFGDGVGTQCTKIRKCPPPGSEGPHSLDVEKSTVYQS